MNCGFDSKLKDFALPISPEAIRDLAAVGPACAQQVGHAFRSQKAGALAEAQDHSKSAVGRCANATARRTSAESAPPEPGSVLLGLGNFIAFGAAVAGEIVQNSATLPYLNNVEPGGLWAAALSAGPAISPIVLDPLLHYGFGVSLLPKSGRARLLCITPIAVASALALATLWSIGETRPIVAAIQTATEATGLTLNQQAIIDTANRLLALSLALTAALCYHLGAEHLRSLYRARRVRRELALLRSEQAHAEEARSKAIGHAAALQDDWNRIDKLVADAVQEHERQHDMALRAVADRVPTIRQQVDSARRPSGQPFARAAARSAR